MSGGCAGKTAADNGRRCTSGVITVYLSLCLILVLALLCTVIESARVSAIEARVQTVSFMGADSLFAEFAEPVFEDYGVMMIWCSESEAAEKFSEYVTENLDTSSSYTDLYRASLTDFTLSSAVHPADNSGEVFYDQVIEYMELYIYEDAAQKILENLGILDETDGVSGFLDKISSYSETFTKVEDSVSKISETVNKVKKAAADPKSLLEDLLENAEEFSENGSSSALTDFNSNLTALKEEKDQLSGYFETIESETDSYYVYVEEAKAAAEELENSLDSEGPEKGTEAYSLLAEELEDLKQKSADTEADYYLVGETKELVSEYSEKLDSLEELFTALNEPLSEETANEYKTLLSDFADSFSEFDTDTLYVNFEAAEAEKEDSSFLETIQNLTSSGMLALVKSDVSELSLDTSELPSKTAAGSASGTDEDSGSSSVADSTTEKVLYSEYVMTHFGNAVNPLSDTALEYETEYILKGKSTDKENLSAVCSEIIAIRTGCNLISILKDSVKKNEAYALASAIAGFTGMPVLVKAVQLVIISVWALAESITDMKALLAGEKVPVIKSASEWNLSVSGLKNFSSNEVSYTSCKSGLDYESYLQVLLLKQKKSNQTLRSMDMVQANMCKNEAESFRIENCITAVTGTASYSSSALFASFGFVKNMVSSAGGRYSFSVPVNYSY